MAAHRLILEEVFEQPFKLIAVHASIEEYRLAFLLNKYLHLRLVRTRSDVDLRRGDLVVGFPRYSFEDFRQSTVYDLVSNVIKVAGKSLETGSGLFQVAQEEQKVFLLPELRKVDFFIKITEEALPVSGQGFLEQIMSIPQISTAYAIEENQIKSRENLIFD